MSKNSPSVSSDETLSAMRSAVLSPTGRVSVGPAFSMSGTFWGVQVYDGRKRVGPFLVAPEGDNTAAGALRSLATVVENAPSQQSDKP